jgi:hypothetical protein
LRLLTISVLLYKAAFDLFFLVKTAGLSGFLAFV